MGSLRDDILKDICEDYKKSGTDSFLYQYILNVKCKEECDREPEKAEAIAKKRIVDLMYNLGYPVAKRGGKPARKVRSHNTLLELMEAWCERKGLSVLPDAYSGPVDTEKYQKAFEAMNDAKKTEGLIPIKVDASTGGGLYIIGKDLYDKDSFPYPGSYSCGIGIIGDVDNRENEVVICMYARLEQGDFDFAPWASGDFPNVKEAVAWYDNVFLKSDDRLNGMRERNGIAPKGMPDGFSKYFEDGYEDDFNILTDENMEETARELE